MDKRKQLRIINDLLDQCGDCPLRYADNYGNPDNVHGHCPLYHQIRAEGDRLIAAETVEKKPYKPRTTLEMTIAEYQKLHRQGLIDDEIAVLKNVSYATLGNWKRKYNIHSQRLKKPVNLTVEEFNKLRAEGKSVKQIRKEVGATESTFRRWRIENGLLDGHSSKPKYTDDQILKLILDNRSNWWINKHYGVSHDRIRRIARDHGIAR
jgi:transposase